MVANSVLYCNGCKKEHLSHLVREFDRVKRMNFNPGRYDQWKRINTPQRNGPKGDEHKTLAAWYETSPNLGETK
jgi:hypothetical protein